MKTIDIFIAPVDSHEDLAAFVPALARAIGQPITSAPTEEGDRYFVVDGVSGSVGPHELENDRDCDFESFPIHIAFYGNARREGVGRRAFETLKATGRYRLLLASDIQAKLDEYRPTPAAAQSAARPQGSDPLTSSHRLASRSTLSRCGTGHSSR